MEPRKEQAYLMYQISNVRFSNSHLASSLIFVIHLGHASLHSLWLKLDACIRSVKECLAFGCGLNRWLQHMHRTACDRQVFCLGPMLGIYRVHVAAYVLD